MRSGGDLGQQPPLELLGHLPLGGVEPGVVQGHCGAVCDLGGQVDVGHRVVGGEAVTVLLAQQGYGTEDPTAGDEGNDENG